MTVLGYSRHGVEMAALTKVVTRVAVVSIHLERYRTECVNYLLIAVHFDFSPRCASDNFACWALA